MLCRVIDTPALQASGQRMKVGLLNAIWGVIGVATMVVAGSQWGEVGIAVGHLVGFVGLAATSTVLARRLMQTTSDATPTVDD